MQFNRAFIAKSNAANLNFVYREFNSACYVSFVVFAAYANTKKRVAQLRQLRKKNTTPMSSEPNVNAADLQARIPKSNVTNLDSGATRNPSADDTLITEPKQANSSSSLSPSTTASDEQEKTEASHSPDDSFVYTPQAHEDATGGDDIASSNILDGTMDDFVQLCVFEKSFLVRVCVCR